MSDTDQKLREILETGCDVTTAPGGEAIGTVDVPDETIEEIKQAFADAGYIQLPNLKPGDYITINAGTVMINRDGTMTPVTRMTGQEWFDRFEKELRGFTFADNHDSRESVNQCWEAAKRAAGLDDTQANN
jgi:hypothetical protein